MSYLNNKNLKQNKDLLNSSKVPVKFIYECYVIFQWFVLKVHDFFDSCMWYEILSCNMWFYILLC